MKLFLRTTWVLLAVGAGSVMPAASTAIGMAVTNGSFQVDHARVWGNTTLFDGSVVETAAAASQLQLDRGVRLRLGAGSRATVYQGKLVLDYGYGELNSGVDYTVEARTLQIVPSVRDTVARVKTEGGRLVTVAAVRGAVRVRNAAGVLVANIDAGTSLNLEPQDAGAVAPTRASGCLLEKAGKSIVADQTTGVVLELQGTDFPGELGNRVEVTGLALNDPPTVPGASQVIQVAGLKLVSKGGCAAVAKKLGAATTLAAAGAAGAAAGTAAGTAGAAAGAATAAGIGAGTVAVIGGVAAAATVGGLAAAGSLPGQGESTPSASR